ALFQLRGQQWDGAEASFKKAIELDPKSGNNLISLGKFYQVRNRFPEAEAQFRRAIDVAPNDPEPRRSLASLYISEGKGAQTEEFLKQVKKDFPKNSVGYRMLGDYFFASNQIDKALTEYTALYQEHPQDITVKNNYIQLLILKNQLDQAKKLNDE